MKATLKNILAIVAAAVILGWLTLTAYGATTARMDVELLKQRMTAQEGALNEIRMDVKELLQRTPKLGGRP